MSFLKMVLFTLLTRRNHVNEANKHAYIILPKQKELNARISKLFYFDIEMPIILII